VAYWAVAQLQPNRTALALQMLVQEGFTVYAPKLRERRPIRGRREDSEVALFPGYAFVAIELQWHAARWCPGVIRLVMDGLRPAKVSDAVIEEIRSRERNGAVELPKRALRRGDRLHPTNNLRAHGSVPYPPRKIRRTSGLLIRVGASPSIARRPLSRI
jgi:transcription antitermination factor NusG